MCVCNFISSYFISSNHIISHLIEVFLLCYEPMDNMATMVRISSVHLYVSEQMRVLLIIGSTGNSAIRRPVG